MVRQVCGSNLHARNTVIDKRLHGRRIPGGAQNIQTMLLNMVEYLVHLLNTQREPGEQIQGVLHAQILARSGAAALAVECIQIAQLEFHSVHTGFHREVHQLFREVYAPLVVIADLGDDEGGRILANGVLSDTQHVLFVHCQRHQVAAFVNERNMLDAAREIAAQRFGVAIGGGGLRVRIRRRQCAGL